MADVGTAAQISGEIQGISQISASVITIRDVAVELVQPDIVSPPSYQGSYEFTPSAETQIVNVSGMIMTDDITINPVPTNYGLVEWNGSVLTVS